MSNRSILNPGTSHAPLRKLDDQQLLDHTRHLVHAERQLLVLILDFLDEIETRCLALERGYSGLFKYVTGELGYSDGGAWRRIQAMHLCRRMAGVRDKLSSGALTLTTAAQLQTAFERRERTRKRELGGTRATVPGTAPPGGNQRGAAATPSLAASAPPAPPGDNQPEVVATGDQGLAEGRQRNERPGAAVPAGQEPRVAAPVPNPALSAPPEHDAHTHALAEEDLVAQVAGKSSRAVARIIAAADPEVTVPRDTLRPLGEDRYTLKCTIDGECQRGLVQLKGLLSHLDPALSWSTVVARLVQDGIRRYDPRVGGRRGASAATGAAAEAPQFGTDGAESLVQPAPGGSSRDELPGEGGCLLPRQGEHGAGESVAACGTAASGVAEHPRVGATSGRKPARELAEGPPVIALTSPPKPAQELAEGPPLAAPTSPPKPAPAGASLTGVGQRTSAGDAGRRAADASAHRPRAPSARAIPAAIKRAVWQRDQARCAFVDPLTGRRCSSQHLLQIDHLQPVARGGGADLRNLRLLCEAHHLRRHRRSRTRRHATTGAGRAA